MSAIWAASRRNVAIDPTGTFTIGRYHSRQQKAPEFEMIALSASRLVRLVFVGHDRPKENPTLAVE